MRSILEFFTKTPLRGILVGTFFTAIIQSSSAATVMAVSFVNSGLMNLYQAAGVIMGANIGTTITSQLIAFNLSELAPVIIMAGIFMLMFSRKTRVQRAGRGAGGLWHFVHGAYLHVLCHECSEGIPADGKCHGFPEQPFPGTCIRHGSNCSTAELFCNCGNYPAAC